MRQTMLVTCLLIVACKPSVPNDGTAIDFTLTFGGSIANTDFVRITELQLSVSQAETFATTIGVAGKLTSRTLGLRYKPNATSGVDSFSLRGVDSAGGLIAAGTIDVKLKPGTQVINFALNAAASEPSGDMAMAAPDGMLAGGADLATSMPDASVDAGDPCGGCPDQCVNGGTLNHFKCVAGVCVPNGGGNCGLYRTCSSGSQCATTCAGDDDCVANAWCDPNSKTCKSKSPLGGPCSREGSDRECASPYVCSWAPDAQSGFCTATRCTGCHAGTAAGDCNNYVKYGTDPRDYCAYVDECNKGFCGGMFRECDDGTDSAGFPRPCGSGVKCTNSTDPNGYATITGSICSNVSLMGGDPEANSVCTPNSSTSCYDEQSYGYCSRCNASLTACDNVNINWCG